MDELERGRTVEQEHADTYKWLEQEVARTGHLPAPQELYQRIAEDHLKELPDYYTRLAEMESPTGEHEYRNTSTVEGRKAAGKAQYGSRE